MTTYALRDEGALDDCWNRIGVAGDYSCPKLATAVHCRNCEVYADAAQRNLQRPVDPDYQREWASYFRRVTETRVKQDSSAMVFRIGHEWLALPTRMFVSVAPQARAHALPHRAGGALLGVVNVSSQLYPCIALASLLGIDEHETMPHKSRHIFARTLLVECAQQAYALPVADLHGIVRYASAGMQAPAATINKGVQRFLAGVIRHQELHIGCLDVQLLGHQLARALR